MRREHGDADIVRLGSRGHAEASLIAAQEASEGPHRRHIDQVLELVLATVTVSDRRIRLTSCRSCAQRWTAACARSPR